MPDWLNATAVGAVVAALGYIGKLIVEGVSASRRERRRQYARLVELRTLLTAAHAAVHVQFELRDRLLEKLPPGPGIPGGNSSAETKFSDGFAKFESAQRDLHTVIRGYTQHALRPLNQAMTTWLEEDVYYKTGGSGTDDEACLAKLLRDLHPHLVLWLAKCAVWIPDRPEHALVFLDDEERHGVKFPPGMDAAVDKVIESQSRGMQTDDASARPGDSRA
jgi:hypothetical protein